MPYQSPEEKLDIKNKAWLKQYKLDKCAREQRYKAMSGTKSIEEVEYPDSGKTVVSYFGYGFRKVKSGEYGKQLNGFFVEYCPLYKCKNCDKTGSGKSVSYRSDLGSWFGKNFNNLPILCMSCWNKSKSIRIKELKIKEITKPLTDLRRAIRKAKI